MSGLPRRTLGRTGLEVATLGFGAMALALPAGRGPSDSEAKRLLNAALDAGINVIDTAIDYGLSAERIGRFIAHRRSEYVLASKCGCVPGSTAFDHVNTAENVRAGVEQSLRTLRTGYLDLVQFHQSLPRKTLEESGALEAALALKREGTVRFVGSSSVLPQLLQHLEMGVFDVFQIPYSLLQREHEALISLASAAGAGIVIRGGVARGLPADWEGRASTVLPGATMLAGSAARGRWEAARLDELLDGMSRQEFVLRFTLSHPDLDTTIVGTRNLAHLQENLAAAARGPLPPDLVAEAKRRLTRAREGSPAGAG